MTDMKAINAEAHRLMAKTHICFDVKDYCDAYCVFRDQLIKEGWTQPDEAEELVDAVLKYSRVGAIQLVRRALAKARAHPADVVEAAEDVHRRYAKETSPRLMAEYILKDVWREPTE